MNNVVLDAQRPIVRRSWVRSRMCGIDQTKMPELPFKADLELQSPFARAAVPVLQKVGEMLHGMRVSAVLLDASGCFLTSSCDDASLRRRMERGMSSAGFSFAEEHMGTNAAGIALEDRVPAIISGQEHYVELLRDQTCAAAPIINPFTQRLEGVIDLSTMLPNSSPLMLPIVLQAVKSIEQALLAQGTPVERALLDRFLVAKRRPGNIVLALGDRTEVTTSNAAQLGPADRTLLQQRADDFAAAQPVQDRMTLADGRQAIVTFETVMAGARRAGAIVEVSVEGDGARSGRRVSAPVRDSAAAGSLVGRSQAMRFLRTRLTQLAGSAFPLVVTGEAGVGKSTLARALAGDEYVLVDAGHATPESESALLREVAGVIEMGDRTVIVRDIGSLSTAAMHRLGSLAESARSNESRLLCTYTELDGPEPTSDPAFGVRLRIPPLRERPEDLLDLIPAMLQRRGSRARVGSPVVQELMRYDWPGNIRELDSLLDSLVGRGSAGGRTGGREVTLADLPLHYRRGARRLRRIEHVERNAIIQALLECGGNKTKAAELLEIGRATLYRKIRVYGLEAEFDLSG